MLHFKLLLCVVNNALLTLTTRSKLPIPEVSGKCPAIWISREPFAWPWCNSADSQRRPYSACVNSHSSVGLVSRQRDAADWARIQISILTANLALGLGGGTRSRGEPNLNCRGADRHDWCDVLPIEVCTIAVEWTGALVQVRLSARSVPANVTVTRYTSSVNGVSLPTDQPHGRVMVHACAVRSPLTGCKVTSRPRDRFSRY